MQAKVVQSHNYAGDQDYVTMPLTEDTHRGKIIMPATKEIVKETRARRFKKNAINARDMDSRSTDMLYKLAENLDYNATPDEVRYDV